MRIKEVRTYSKDLGTSRPYSIAYKTVDSVVNAFVEIELENGITGIGSANPSHYVVGESVDDTINRLEKEDFEFLIGKDIRGFEGLLRELRTKYLEYPGCNVALDVALHDAFTSYLQIPLVDYFGRKHKELPTSVTIGIKNVEETVKEAEEYRSMQFRIVKVKTGKNPEEDAERIRKIHEAIPGMIIRVDANQGYTPDDLRIFLEGIKGVSLDLIEQPFPVDRFIEQIESLNQSESELLVADESLKNPDDAFDLIRNSTNCRIFNIKLMKTGGLLAARQIADIGDLQNVKLMWGCNDESAVSITAALHLALARRSTEFLDLDGSLDLVEDVVSGGFSINDGFMTLSGGHGLGLKRI